MMGAVIVVLALGLLTFWSVVVARQRVRGADRATADGPARLLAWAIGLLPAGREVWGRAMVGELARLQRRSQRWRFALGCLAATLLTPPRQTSERLLVALVAAATSGCAGMLWYGLVRYPGVLSGTRAWLTLATFAAVLAGFILVSVVLARRGAPSVGLVGGLTVAAVWTGTGVVVVSHAASPLFSVLLLALPVASLVVGALGTWRGRTRAVGRQAALVAAVITGLMLFLVLAGDGLATAGGPYDPALVRDFPGSGLPDLATYAVSDSLGTAMSLLLLASVVTAATGWVGARMAARIGLATADR